MKKPLLFISHKHSDAKIAKCIADFVKDKSLNNVDVHVSSDPGFQGPKLGKNLNDELRMALKNTNALILVYTSDDRNWSYCMWECGVATDPESPRTNILVFQCGRDVPSPFTDVVRVNARELDDIRKFTDMFFRSPEFFPGADGAIAPNFEKQQTDKLAEELLEELGRVLPPLEADEEWSAWPRLCLELPRDEVDALRQEGPGRSTLETVDVIKKHAVVCDTERVPPLFGLASLPTTLRFEELLSKWTKNFPGLEAAWFDSCCEQMHTALRREVPVIRMVPLIQVGGKAEFVTVVSRVYDLPSQNKTRFDIHFYNLTDPRAIPVTAKMLPAGSFFFKNLGDTPAEKIKLRDLRGELAKLGLNRVPLVSQADHPQYMIHRSMIEQFMVNAALDEGAGKEIQDLTLVDLLDEPSMKEMFESTFAVVNKKATLADATNAMELIQSCRDVFVTENGTATEPVLGWLTNVDLAGAR